MPNSKKQQILDAIVACFCTISVANGYNTELGVSIFLWKSDSFQDSEIPGANITESESAEQQIGVEWHTLSITVKILDFTDESARQCQADIITAIALDRTWGGLAEETGVVTGGPVAVDGGEKNYIAATVSFDVEFTTENMNAYA